MRRAAVYVGLTVSFLLAACGGKTQEPVSQAAAAVEESSMVEATTTGTKAEGTAEEETAKEETTAEATTEIPSDPPADAGEEFIYHYEVFTDGQPHKVVYWTDGKIQKSLMFTSLSLPGWGIESISLPSEFVEPEKELYVIGADDDTEARMKLAEEKACVDDSYDYPGAWSRRDEWGIFRVWRVAVDEGFDFANAYPEEIYKAIYPFRDDGSFLINRDVITKYQNPDGTVDYLINCMNRFHWSCIKKTDKGYEVDIKKMYQGYILVRPRGNVAHCICYATTDEEWDGESKYVMIESATLTDVEDITEGAICKK